MIPAAAALPNAIVSAHGPPVKWKMFTPVKTRPEEERAAALTDWPFRWGVAGLERESMRSVAVVMSWSSVGRGVVVGRPWW